MKKYRFYLKLALEKHTFWRALKVALVVGTILNLINNPILFSNFSLHTISIGKIMLTFLVPYFVSTYSSVVSSTTSKVNISNTPCN